MSGQNEVMKLADYMEAIARRQNPQMVKGYGYQMDVALRVGFLKEENHGCKVLEKPVKRSRRCLVTLEQ